MPTAGTRRGGWDPSGTAAGWRGPRGSKGTGTEIDAFFRTDGIPGPAIAELARKRRIVLVPLDEFVRPLQQRYGGGQTYTAATIPAVT